MFTFSEMLFPTGSFLIALHVCQFVLFLIALFLWKFNQHVYILRRCSYISANIFYVGVLDKLQ